MTSMEGVSGRVKGEREERKAAVLVSKPSCEILGTVDREQVVSSRAMKGCGKESRVEKEE